MVGELCATAKTHASREKIRTWKTCFDFADAFVSPGIKSREELEPSSRAYAWNGASRRCWLGENINITAAVINDTETRLWALLEFFSKFLLWTGNNIRILAGSNVLKSKCNFNTHRKFHLANCKY
jgi:hypothetical protein